MRLHTYLLPSLLLCVILGCGSDAPPDNQSARTIEATPSAPQLVKKSRDFDNTPLPKIALILDDKTGHLRGSGALSEVEDAFTQELLGKNYRLIDRSEIKKVMQEQGFQNSGITDESDAAKLGKVLNVPAVLVVSITTSSAHQESRYNPLAGDLIRGRSQYWVGDGAVTAKLISVETAEILCSGKNKGSEEIPNPQEAAGLLPKIATDLARSFPLPPTGSDGPVAPTP